MKKTQKTLGEKMLLMKVVLNNVSDEGIKTSMAKFGYNETRFNSGQVYYNEVLAMNEIQDEAHAAKLQASIKFKEAHDVAKATFKDNLAIARRALIGDIGSIRELGITGKSPRIFEGWFKMARAFYTTALTNPIIMNRMAIFGVTQQTLEEGLFQINTIEPLFAIQKDKNGLSQVATMSRDAKLAEMYLWYRDFISMARICFRKEPQQLERFGIVKYTPGYSPKKKEKPTPTIPPVTTPPPITTEFNADNPAAE